MTHNEYFKYAIKNNLVNKLDWYYALFTRPADTYLKNDYLVYTEGNLLLKIDGLLEPLEGYIVGTEPLSFITPVTIDGGDIANLDTTIDTTIGIAVANQLLLAKNFDTIIPYILSDLSIGKLEDIIAVNLEEDTISVQQYKDFVDTVKFMENLSRIVTVNATFKTMIPPKGLKEFKVKTKDELAKKYGPKWNKDMKVVVAYNTKLKEFYNDWLADDPTNNKFTSGKIKNNAAVKMYLTFGAEVGMGDDSDEIQQVEGSLLDNTPKDKDKIASMYNTSRAASFSRGAETQKGGSVAKDILRSTSSIKIIDTDCKVNYGKKIRVTKNLLDALVKRTYITSSKQIHINNIEESNSLLGKTIELRSPQYCLTKGSGICGVCAGGRLVNKPDGISLLLTNISGTILTSSLKKMHNSTVRTIVVDVINNIQ